MITSSDPSLDWEDKEEVKCDVPDGVNQHLEKHFKRTLQAGGTAMHPEQDMAAVAPPKLDPFILDFVPKKVDKAWDTALAKI